MDNSEQVAFDRRADVTVAVARSSELTSEMGEALDQELQDLRDGGRPVRFVLDLSSLTFLGSVGMSILLVFLKHVKETGGQLAVAGLNDACRGVLRVCGLDRTFGTYATVSAAVEALADRP